MHRIKPEDINEFSKNPYALELILSSIAALNSNALLFGGIHSTNFKIKAKKMEQRLKKILPLIFP